MNGFRNFIIRGNLVDLAVAFVIGSQFSGLVTQFVKSFVTPLLGLLGATPDLSNLVLTVNKSRFAYGDFLAQALSFLIAAAVIYFLIVQPVNRLLHHFEGDKASTEKDCPECTRPIPLAARRCPECTADLRGSDAVPA